MKSSRFRGRFAVEAATKSDKEKPVKKSSTFPLLGAVILAAAVAALAACAKNEAPKKVDAGGPDVVASIGDRFVLTRQRFEEIWKELPAEARQEYTRRGKDAFVKDWLDRQLLVIEAEDRKLTEETAISTKLDMARSAILAEAMFGRVISESVPDTEARGWFEAHKAEFERPEAVILRQIAVTPRPEKKVTNLDQDDAKDDATAKRKIEALAKMVASGEDFATLARRFGEDSSSANGGLLDPYPASSIPKVFAAALSKIQPGQATEIVKTDFGYHIVLWEGRRPAGAPTFEEVRSVVIDRMLDSDPEKRRSVLDTKLGEIKKKYPVAVHLERLAGSSAAAPATAASAK